MKRGLVIGLVVLSFVLLGVFVGASSIERDIKINEGWNLIHGFIPGSLNGQSLDFSHIKAIYAYDTIEKKYIRLYPDMENSEVDRLGDSWFEKQVMWVYSDTFLETSYILEEPLPVNERGLSAGWNFVGITEDMEDKTFSDLMGDCDIEKVYHFESSVQKWSSNLVNDDFMNEVLGDDALGLGMLMKVSEDCHLGSSMDVEVPELPESGESNCFDSDGGRNYSIKGTTVGMNDKGMWVVEEDYCSDRYGRKFESGSCDGIGERCMIDEFSCVEYYRNPRVEVDKRGVDCPNGCSDGACL